MSEPDPNNPLGAMAGLKVIDCARVLGGPYCTQILADHGATVIKIEPPQGDETRDWGPPFHEGDASYFVGLNRNKRSIGLDLRNEQAARCCCACSRAPTCCWRITSPAPWRNGASATKRCCRKNIPS